MVKLGILIAHYKEPSWQVKRLLDSINEQEGFNFNNLVVRITNDGDDVIINDIDFTEYKFNIIYHICDRVGHSKIRNVQIDTAQEDYIWFVDSDDYILPESLETIWQHISDNSLDLLLCPMRWELKDGRYYTYAPGFARYGVLGCNIMRREFLISKNLRSQECVSSGGDVFLECMPMYYTSRRKLLDSECWHYSYNPKSVTRMQKTNGWRKDAEQVMIKIIERLLSDNMIYEAYQNYIQYIFLYNSRIIHDEFCAKFKEIGLYDINYELDLR